MSYFFRLLMLSLLLGTASVHAYDLKIMSFNIKNGNNVDDGLQGWESRKENVYAIFNNYTPDIVGTQEGFRYQLDDMQAAMPMYGEIGVGRKDSLTDGEYSAIHYLKDKYEVLATGNFWLSGTPDVPGSMGDGATHARICSWARFRD
ncbi:MAG: endonuclease, partial [Flavobacteriales bacterium]|nr:endonuclease [Flavobacteriales bacterium]